MWKATGCVQAEFRAAGTRVHLEWTRIVDSLNFLVRNCSMDNASMPSIGSSSPIEVATKLVETYGAAMNSG